MIKEDYWNVKPHTERKLDILEKYLNAWTDIIFSTYQKNQNWKPWQTPFYVDCFSGRGKYNKNGMNDVVNGSPLIAIKVLLEKKKHFEQKYGVKITPKCRFIEYKDKWAKELNRFIEPYKEELDIEVIPEDFNSAIGKVISETGTSPTFFFVDAGGIKELKSESVERIIKKRGARDILLNYIVDGPKRIGGLAQGILSGNLKAKSKDFKTIESLEDFTGMPIYKYLSDTNNENREALLNYIQNVLHANSLLQSPQDRLQTVVYDMKDLKRQRLVYYLLFSSRKQVATDIMKSIFKQSKKQESSQLSLLEGDILEVKKRK